MRFLVDCVGPPDVGVEHSTVSHTITPSWKVPGKHKPSGAEKRGLAGLGGFGMMGMYDVGAVNGGRWKR
jgi:hypothetical protein